MQVRLLVFCSVLLAIFACNKPHSDGSNTTAFTKNIIAKRLEANLNSGSLWRIDSFPSNYIQARNVDIWLPSKYNEHTSYDVLYMHDGQMLFDATTTWNGQEWRVDEIADSLQQLNTVRPFIVVAVWNNSNLRHAEYFPQKAFEMLPVHTQDSLLAEAKTQNSSLASANLLADKYLNFLVKELKPYIDKHYKVNTGVQNTFIAGSSMGGLISMYAVCEYPDVFGGAACISTHWPGIMPADYNPVPIAFFEYMYTNLPKANTHKFYFDYGNQTLDAYYPQYADAVNKVFETRGYKTTHFQNLFFEGANHSEDAWNKRFQIPLTFLFSKK